MVSSPVNNNLWAYRVPANQNANNGNGAIRLYGDANIANHRMRPGNWPVGWSIKTITGATINVEDVVYGRAVIGIWYPDGLGARYDIYFPQGQEIDNITAYALDHVQNILYIKLDDIIYSVNLDDAHENGEVGVDGEFVVW
jgi:hypothetical protein